MNGDGTIRVLVAEDDVFMREALASVIACEETLRLVATVADAPEAIEEAARLRPDVAVVDVRMPGGGGAAATRGIRRRSPATVVLALSADHDRATVMTMLEAGATGYLVKGSSIDAIIAAITNAAHGHGSLSAEVTSDVIRELAGELQTRRRTHERTRRREGRIRHVLGDGTAMTMAFQPICTLDGSVIGAEALARFAGPPHRGPDRWFAEAAEVGLLEELELAAVRAALAELPRLAPTLFLGVNISPATLAGQCAAAVFADVDASRVVVEVTEHAPIEDYDRLRSSLAALRELGVRLAVDDAGAGFASLRHILRLEPEFIKLDRTLIDGIATDRSRRALAAGLISFAEAMGATVVAEGVERAQEVEVLTELGASLAQGYYFARPGPLPLGLAYPEAIQ